MTWTATSPISGSKWDGPSGCPIISPSNWHVQVLDNLTVLASHDHSGSAGEGLFVPPASFFPAIDNDTFSAFFPTACTGWIKETAPTGSNAAWIYNGVVATSTLDASIAYDIYTRTGTYTLDLYGNLPAGLSRGVLTACINGSGIGTMGYGSNNSVCGFSINTNGEKTLTLIVSSCIENEYTVKFSAIYIRRTGS